MKLVCLGTGGYHPSDRRQTACLMLPDAGVLLDAGTALFRAGEYLATNSLDIFLTHCHLDHIIGLTYLFNVLRHRSMQEVRVYGEHQKLEHIDHHLFAEALFPARPAFQLKELTERVQLPDGGQLSWFRQTHPGGSVGFRIDWPSRSMAYVTDTTASTEVPYVRNIQGVDLLVHECYFADGREEDATMTGHSCATPTATVAKAAEVGRLLIVHINPLQDEAAEISMLETMRTVFPATELAFDRMEVEF